MRLVPPLEPDLGDYWIVMTTPYIVLGVGKDDWTAYVNRAMVECNGSDDVTRLYRLMKYGPERNYWNEYIFKAYVNYQFDAVFLTGVPDIKATLPHA